MPLEQCGPINPWHPNGLNITGIPPPEVYRTKRATAPEEQVARKCQSNIEKPTRRQSGHNWPQGGAIIVNRQILSISSIGNRADQSSDALDGDVLSP